MPVLSETLIKARRTGFMGCSPKLKYLKSL